MEMINGLLLFLFTNYVREQRRKSPLLFFLQCYLLFTVCNYRLLFHMRLPVMLKKKKIIRLSGFVF